MKMDLFLATVALAASPAGVLSQPEILWIQTYGGGGNEECRSMVRTEDGGFALFGETASFGNGSIDYYAVKTDGDGDLEWTGAYGGERVDQAHSGVQTADGGYAIGGTSATFGNGAFDFYLVKTDDGGEMEWQRAGYGRNGYDHCQSLLQTPDGGYSMAGKLDGNRWDFHLIQTNEEGAPQWARSYHRQWSESANSHAMTEDGGFIIAGHANLPNQDIWDVFVVRADDEGNQEWARSYGGEDSDLGMSVAATRDGGYVIAGMTNSFGEGQYDGYLIKIDDQGELLWSRTFGGEGDEILRSVIETEDGGLIAAGWTFSFGEGGADGYVVRIDEEGEDLWSMTFGGRQNDYASAVTATEDGGYAIAGSTESFGEGGLDFFLIRTERDPVLNDEEPPVMVIDPEDLELFWDDLDIGEIREVAVNIANVGAGMLWWSVSSPEDWIACSPRNGELPEGGDEDLIVTFQLDIDRGVHETQLTIRSNDPERRRFELPISIHIEKRLSVELHRGWNLISLNVRPGRGFENENGQLDIEIMTAQFWYRDDDRNRRCSLELMKDGEGRFYVPELDFNNIPFWNLGEGYFLKINPAVDRERVVAFWTGEMIGASEDILITPGWSIIPYYPAYELDASAPEFHVVEGIVDFVALAKDGDGRFMAPPFDFSNMVPWRETQGYQIKSSAERDVILNYPEP